MLCLLLLCLLSRLIPLGASPVVQVSQDQISAFLSQVKASPACCAAACDFNAKGCNCDAGVLMLASGFLDGDLGNYR